MKRILQLALGLMISGTALAQTENVGIGTTKPEPSAILDLNASNKGLLMPRMSADQRSSIANPAQGLMVYQTGKNSGFYYFEGNAWKPVAPKDVEMAMNNPEGWSIGGNTGTTSTHYIGTSDNQPLRFRINNTNAGSLSTTNAYYGLQSGNFTTTGTNNVAVGTNSLYATTTGTSNVSIGMNSMFANTIGGNNVGIGFQSLNNNSSGSGNIGVGANSMYSNTTGTNNMGIGVTSLFSNTSGGNNTGLGYQSLFANTTGTGNTSVGSNSMLSNTTGNNNMALGAVALNKNTIGSNNVGIGSNALENNTSGSNNLALGNQSGFSNSSGSRNVFIGYQAGYNETTNDKLYVSNNNTATPLIYGDFSAKYVTIGDVPEALRNQGTATGGYNLLVKGGILTEKVKVAVAAAGTDWADYVFEPNYKLMSLDKVELYTKENKHLPNVPTADQLAKDGLDLGQTSKMFMEKIEELTLYIIQLNKEIEMLKKKK